ncbi:MAG: S8 family serine peptidase, partial [Myxococcota bacterium]|nr:S8 family serine peptidase [Myxococcota bacterium]
MTIWTLAVVMFPRWLPRARLGWLAVWVSLALLWGPGWEGGSPAPAFAAEAAVGSALQGRIANLVGSETLRFSVQLDPAGTPGAPATRSRRASVHARQQLVIDDVKAAGSLEVLRRYENLPGFAARGGAEIVKALAAQAGVVAIYEDRAVYATLAEGVSLVSGDQAAGLGFTGSGVSVAILDTGIDTDHADLTSSLEAERCWCSAGAGPFNGCCPNGTDTMSGSGAAEDGSGHGTHAAGIVTADGLISSSGVAPGAGIVALKVLSDTGSGSFSDVDAALDWIISNHATYNIRAVNLSISDGVEHSNSAANPCSGSVTANAIQDLVELDIAVIASSGNDGYDGGIGFPACVPEAISVGGVYDADVGSASWCDGATCSPALCVDSTTSADQFVCHTNSSADLDILAPNWRTRTTTVGGGVTNFGGTSAAAPYVAGLVALLADQDPSRTPEDFLSLMTDFAPDIFNPDNGLFFPRADVGAAFSVCGNGSLETGEQCDDSNTTAGDCCSELCEFEPAGSSCDDGDACTEFDQCGGTGACDQSSAVVCDNGLYCDGLESCDALLG